MKVPWQTKGALIITVTAVMAVAAQSPTEGPTSAQQTQVRGYWIDPSTKLIWAAKDNGQDVTWHKAMKYCRDLRLGGYSDWRLASVGELQGIYDKDANAPGLAGPDHGPSTWHVKGNLFLTGNQWSSERSNDDRGHPSAYAWYFDFNGGKSNDQPSGFPYSSSFMRGLCVRGPGQ
jgi:hypothetical protein